MSRLPGAPYRDPQFTSFRLPSKGPEMSKSTVSLRKYRGNGPSGTPISGPIESIGGRKDPPGIENGWLPDFLAQEVAVVEWIIEPFLPRGGVVFLHGPTSVGKSPFTWALATSVSEGIPFCGYPVKHSGVVLYVELDTPGNLLQPRLRCLRVMPQLMWLEVLHRPIDICGLDEDSKLGERLHELQASLDPVLVIVNTLRKAHTEDDKDSSTPSRVYGAWRAYFPEAALLFVHHDKKTPTGKKEVVDEDQMFSGSQHWANDAQVALHIKRAKKVNLNPGETLGEYTKTPIVVRMTKSQVSDHERFPPLQMRLESDGTNWVEMGPAAYRHFFATLGAEMSYAQRIELVMEQFQIGKSAAYAACKGVE